MVGAPSGHIEQLPSGSYRVHVYVGIDPITRKRVYLRETAKDHTKAQVVLGKLLAQAQAGREPESDANVSFLLDQYVPLAEWDVSTRETCEGYIRRTIRPALGHLPVRKVRSPILDQLYGRLKKCGDLACTRRSFIEHRNVPDLRVPSASGRTAWERVASKLRDAIASGALPAGTELPSVRELHELQGLPTATVRCVFAELAAEGLIVAQQGRSAVVTGEVPDEDTPGRRPWRPGRGHDCALAGCQRHVCKPMKPNTIRQIHSILSGAFDTARRWDTR